MLANIPYMEHMGYDLTMNNGHLHLAVLKHCWKIHEIHYSVRGFPHEKQPFFWRFPSLPCLIYIYMYIVYSIHTYMYITSNSRRSSIPKPKYIWSKRNHMVCPRNWSGKLFLSYRWDNHALMCMDKLRNVDLLARVIIIIIITVIIILCFIIITIIII